MRSNGAAIPGNTWELQFGEIYVTPPSAKPGGTDEVYTVYDGSTETVGGPSTTVHWLSAPVVSSVSPATGSKGGGTSVVLTGTGFNLVDGVSFGSQAAASFTVDSGTQITATTAVDVASEVDVTVSISDVNMGAGPDPMVSATSANTKFTFTEGPNIAGLLPTSGSVDGGEPVVISGGGFTGVTGAAGVTFGGTNATSYTVDSDTQITAVTPAQSAGMVSVVVPSDVSQPATPTAPQPPATPPRTDLQLTTDQGDISNAAPGQQITFIGTGFAPHSTAIITIYSDPIEPGTAVTDGNGDFSKLVTIPAGLAVGDHTAVAQGVAPDGLPRAMALAITVAPTSSNTSGGNGGSGGLPVTGPAAAMMLAIGLGLTTGGTVLVGFGNRRRRRA
ncbi:IPT/TIG domain-containing protein [Dactylosporangium sp. NPDC005555]|uniref:IPT/TIG domain-containing protein n=1 Tax=Dactylosporangium sp. NPDC005555 TaxID=3154889 RepID=UPI0033ABD739